MEKYSIIEIETGIKVQTNLSYQECLDWLSSHGNIMDYTIVKEDE